MQSVSLVAVSTIASLTLAVVCVAEDTYMEDGLAEIVVDPRNEAGDPKCIAAGTEWQRASVACDRANSVATMSGVMVYSTDAIGDPSGLQTFRDPEEPESHLFRTVGEGKWHSLAIYPGLPPLSLVGRPQPLNAPDFSVDIPLIEGENFFTIVGEPGPITVTDLYDRFAINLYIDGDLDLPGISVLFPRYAPLEGADTSASFSSYIYSVAAILVQERTPSIDDPDFVEYDSGTHRISVAMASFLPEDRAISVDLVSAQGFGASGVNDFVGSMVVLVEPSEIALSNGGSGDGCAIVLGSSSGMSLLLLTGLLTMCWRRSLTFSPGSTSMFRRS